MVYPFDTLLGTQFIPTEMQVKIILVALLSLKPFHVSPKRMAVSK